jgi:hypothetical protein
MGPAFTAFFRLINDQQFLSTGADTGCSIASRKHQASVHLLKSIDYFLGARGYDCVFVFANNPRQSITVICVDCAVRRPKQEVGTLARPSCAWC